MSISGQIAIVGVHEYESRFAPDKTEFSIMAESAREALVRELREEVGADVAVGDAILIVDGPDVDAVEVILRGALIDCHAMEPLPADDPLWTAPGALVLNLKPTVRAMVLQALTTVETEATYNLIVADFHTYFVGNSRLLSHDNTICVPTDNNSIPRRD